LFNGLPFLARSGAVFINFNIFSFVVETQQF
jgi:hypothetical protein